MVDVILIHSPMVVNRRGQDWIFSDGDEVSNYHMGLLYLSAYLEKNGMSVKILDVIAARITLEDILENVAQEKPTVVGISATSSGLRSAVSICRRIKENFEGVPVCIGGAHVNCDPHFHERVPVFDYCVMGEGEKTFYESVVKLKNGEKVEGILQGESIEPLDDVPFPARHLIEFQDYVRWEHRNSTKKPNATMLGSRGCPFKCTFCSIPAVGHKVRYRSAKNIVDEMEAIYDTCDGNYTFVDDVLTLNQNKTIELCDEIIKRGLGDKVKWNGMTRAEILGEKLVAKMAKAGCNDLFFGIESGSERVRTDVIAKKISNEEIKDAVSLCRKYGIVTNFFLMVGFPTETHEEIQETVEIGKKSGADMIGIHQTIPFPGTGIYDYSVKNGLIEENLIDRFALGDGWSEKESFHDNWPNFVPEGLETKDLVDAKKRAYREHYLRPSWAWSRVKLWMKAPYRFKQDLNTLRHAPDVFIFGKTLNTPS